ncbi:hypothetical protein BCR42DRAFT_426256 [Absidia repens]|uniref:Heterokaryon incompatibility domain-containing protein n=1 Tax=Absidia repens TaxID=90262 RepID=A0A1X2I1L8_9FUNG|nr:hypothetical protein BCR42DRAFT_426256 [Absidia repens]
MTIDEQVEQSFKELSQEQQRPFHIVLVDINKAANGRIHCVELPLTDDVKFVALSYRWGELQEKMVDTDVGYTATVTSFRLEDFCQMCRVMTLESDLRSIDYVWVDAICVDQTNYEKRKATIHQMTNIYEHATFVVAVPDLHLQYLKNTSTIYRKTIQRAAPFRKDIYYLLHKKMDALMALEDERLDFYGVPKDPALRRLLTKYTNYFTEGFTTFREHHYDYNPEEILDHIYESTQVAHNNNSDINDAHPSPFDKATSEKDDGILGEIQRLHNCNKATCPFVSFIHGGRHGKPSSNSKKHSKKGTHEETTVRSGRNREWKQQIYDRGQIIQQTMSFLSDLVTDWSSRAWVISEFNIAKKKKNALKYWFVQLIPGSIKEMHHMFVEDDNDNTFTFFDFDFNDPSHADFQNAITSPRSWKISASDPVYLKFHQTMVRQLNEQTFLEMILKSKASRAEDRYYAVLPLSQKYKHRLTSKEFVVVKGEIHTLLSVKLKLYEWMDTKDKLTLVFLSCYRKERDLTLILPTFATPTIYWPSSSDCFSTEEEDANQSLAFNFDLTDDTTITLHYVDDLYSLHLKPLEYYTTLCRRLQLNGEDRLDVIAIPHLALGASSSDSSQPTTTSVFWIQLIGNVDKNKWVFDKCTLACSPTDSSDWVHHYSRDDTSNAGFNIY